MQRAKKWSKPGAIFTWKRLAITWVLLAVFAGGVIAGQNGLISSKEPYASRTRLPKVLNYSQIDEVYQALKNNYNGALTEEQVLEGLKHGLAGSTNDPYTEFFSAKEAAEFQNDLQGTITGVGAKLELDQDKNIVIVAPLSGSPAEAAGLRAKDIIIAVDDKTSYGMTATEAVLKIRGPKGTKVKLTIVRDKKEQLEFTITRDVIHVPSVESKVLEGNVGYLQVSQFSDDTDELAEAAAESFREKGIREIILDLRDNPGGEVASAVGLGGLWLQKGQIIVQQRRGDTTYATDTVSNITAPFKRMKTAVLINGGSASASEIVALALRDHLGARIIGEKSYGKGVVQQLVPFDDGSSLKVTIGKWYSPKGTNIDKKGITPDQEIKPTEEDIKSKNDVQLKAATEWIRQ
ncbi:S41 family peptidase [Candidatus Saccharibacteria bacterium]|nr:MAG: S41 family peptidase [Candidatus Saccharibacteria bacterium]